MNIGEINKLAKQIFEANKEKGWWDDMNRSPFDTLQLCSTEVAEATEGERKNLMDDKLPHRPMGEVEIADFFIRAADIAGRYGIRYSPNLVDPVFWCYGTDTFAAFHLAMNKRIIQFADIASCTITAHDTRLTSAHYWLNTHPDNFSGVYSEMVRMCIDFCERKGYDLWGAVEEKLAFNAVRVDHTREHRASKNGKKI